MLSDTPDPAAIANGLTPETRHLLGNIPADNVWRASHYYRSHETVLSVSSLCQLLKSKGLVETSIDAVSRLIVYRLTPLGIAVREVLKEQNNG